MGALLSYSVTSGISLLLMYLLYDKLFSSINQPGTNRIILLSIYAVSFLVVPLFTEVSSTAQGIPDATTVLTIATPHPSMPDAVAQNSWDQNILTTIIFIYISGVAVLAIATLFALFSTWRLIHSGEKSTLSHGYTLVIVDNEKTAPFSWMRYVVMNRKDFTESADMIITHELKHLGSKHWIDMMLAQSVIVLNWFNPGAWLMRRALRNEHEFQADRSVIDCGIDVRKYQLLLVRKAAVIKSSQVVDSLNNGTLKKRITMMQSEVSATGKSWRIVAFIPIIVMIIMSAEIPAVSSAINLMEESSLQIPLLTQSASGSEKDGELSLSGRVTDSSGNPVIGAIVMISGGSKGTVTDMNGYFGLKAESQCKIRVLYPGFNELEIDCKNTAENLLIVLETSGNASDQRQKTTSQSRTEKVYFIDGQEVDEDVLDDFPPSEIRSITIDKSGGATSALISTNDKAIN